MTALSITAFLKEARRRRVFRLVALYFVGAWVALQAADLAFPGLGIPESAIQYVWIGAIMGVPVALFFGWRYDIIGGRIVRTAVSDVDSDLSIRRADYVVLVTLSAVVAVTAFGLIGQISDTRVTDSAQFVVTDIDPNSIAVLPFVNMSGNPDNEYFSDGLTETLLHALAQLPGLKVSARTSAFFFKGKEIDIREVARKLGVRNVLEGSVQRDGNKVRIVVQLIEAETGFHRWSNTYNREMSDIFAMQDDIANSVALALEVTLAGGGRIDTAGTDNTTAYLKYLQGRQQMRTGSHASLARAALSLKEALALDPDYYAAKRELADTYWRHGSIGLIQRSEATELVMPLLVRLLEERPNDGLVLALAARVRGYAAIDVEQHYAELLAAIERAPNESRLYPRIAFVLARMHRQEEAIEWLDRAIVLDPLNARLHFTRANVLVAADDLDGAETAYARAIELNPADPNFYGFAIQIDWRRKQYDQWFAKGRQGMEVDSLDYEFPIAFALTFYTFGLMDEGDKYLQRAVAVAPEAALVKAAQLYRLVFRGEYERAREMSETLLREGIDDRRAAHWFVVMVFVSTMIDIDQADAALAVLEELSPGVTSPGFIPANLVQRALQYYAILIQAQAQGEIAPLIVLETMLEEREQAFPGFPQRPSLAAPVAMARGQQELAVELALEDLDGRKNFIMAWDWPLRYRHIYFYKALAQDPTVAKRLKELEEEAKKGGEDIWNYIVQHDLQL